MSNLSTLSVSTNPSPSRALYTLTHLSPLLSSLEFQPFDPIERPFFPDPDPPMGIVLPSNCPCPLRFTSAIPQPAPFTSPLSLFSVLSSPSSLCCNCACFLFFVFVVCSLSLLLSVLEMKNRRTKPYLLFLSSFWLLPLLSTFLFLSVCCWFLSFF